MIDSSRRPATPSIGAVDFGLAALLFLFALGLRAVAIQATGFDGLYGQDPFAYLDYSIALKRALRALSPPPPFFWPIGYPLLVALAMTAGGEEARAAQFVSVTAGSLAAPLVYFLVRELRSGDRAGALVAGGAAATASQLMISSMSVMSDAAGLAWITASAWALLRHHRAVGASPDRALVSLSLAAFAFASAVLTRWAYLVCALPFGLATLVAWKAGGVTRRWSIAATIVAAGIVVLVVGLPLAADLGREPWSHAGDLRVVGWDPRNAFRSTIANSDGTFHYERPVGLFYASPLIHPSFVFPLFSPFVLFGLLDLRRGPRSSLALFAGWPLTVYVLLTGIAWENPRFSLTSFPALLVLAGAGVARAAGSPRAALRRTAIGCAALGLAGSLAWSAYDVRRFSAVKRDQLEAARWAERSTPEGSTIVSFGLTQTLAHYTRRNVANLYLLSTADLAGLASAQAPSYLLIDPVNVDEQWRGKSPALNLEWLRAHTVLTDVGRRPPWVLSRIEAPVDPGTQTPPAGG